MTRKNQPFYFIALFLLALVLFLFNNAYRELKLYSELTNRSSKVRSCFQKLEEELTEAAVINPDLIEASKALDGDKLFYTDSLTVIGHLDTLLHAVKDTVNIKIAHRLDMIVRSELPWMLRSNVPDSIIRHQSITHIAKLSTIDSLVTAGIDRTTYLLSIHKVALTKAMNRMIVWMVLFIGLAAALLLYTAWKLFREKDTSQAATKALAETEERFRYTLDHMIEGAQIHDDDWRYTYVNDTLVKYSTYTREQLIGHTLMELYPGIEGSELFQTLVQCKKDKIARHLETEFYFPNGTRAFFELSIEPVPEGIFILSVDITKRKHAEEQLQKANRLYSFISAINQSIVHIKDEKRLLDHVCGIAIKIGKFKMAWIGLLDEAGRLNMVNVHGDPEAVKVMMAYSGLDYSQPGLNGSVTGRAISTGKYTISNDVSGEAALSAWREQFERFGIRSNISLPLKRGNKVIGIYGLNASTAEFFDTAEIGLLEEAAGDISFAMEVYDKERMKLQADMKLAQSESKLKDAQAVAHLGSWEIDMSTGAITWSDEHYRLFGYEVNEVEPSNELFMSMIHPDDRPLAEADFGRIFQSFETMSGSLRMIRRDLSLIHVFCEWKFELDAKGHPVRIYGITQDVTESKKAEERLALFASIVNTSDDAIISKTLDGIITSWNRGAEKTLGYAPEEIVGRHISMLIPPELAGEEVDIQSKIRQGIPIDHYQTERIRKDGTRIYVSLTISPIKDARGHIIGASKILHDTTARRKAEQKITELNEQLQSANMQLTTIFNTLPANIALLNERGDIIAVNKGWKEFADENELQSANYNIGDNYINVCENSTGNDSELASQMAEETKRVIQNNLNAFSLEYPCHSPRQQRWFRAEVRPYAEQGRSGAVIMHVNITERKLAEDAVLQLNNELEERVEVRTSELQEANKALEAFSYSVSHDLRAPVRAMIGFTSIIKSEYGEGFNEDLRNMFEHIIASSRRMNAIIDDMLTLARYEKEKMQPAPVDIHTLFSTVWDHLSFTTPHHALLQLSALPVVMADSSMLQQVITNLLSNAIKYSSKKEKPLIEVGCEESESMITFFIKDNGAGFDMKSYSRLFGAFQRLHGSSEFEGTGVGLLLVKRIIERHGGHVWAEGKVGEGATFYFSIPASHEVTEAGESTSS